MRAIRLLFSSSTFSRGSFGKPSRMMMLLSERSMLSNWFCSRRTHPCQGMLPPPRACPSYGSQISHPICMNDRMQHMRTCVAPKFSMALILEPVDQQWPAQCVGKQPRVAGHMASLTVQFTNVLHSILIAQWG